MRWPIASLITTIITIATIVPSRTHAGHAAEWGDVIFAPRVDVPGDPDMLARCDYLARGALANTHLGYMVVLLDGMGTGATTYTLADGLMGALFPEPTHPDVTFFADLGTCGPPVEPTITGRSFGPLEKHGVIPAGSRFALVTIPGDVGSTFYLTTDFFPED